MITIIDYGYGNIFSIVSAFKKIGHQCIVTDKEEEISKATILILPGVGSFNQAMLALKRKKLEKKIIDLVNKGKNIIGICLGYQMLFDSSKEFGEHKGLGLIKGEVISLQNLSSENSKIPNVGWRSLLLNQQNENIREVFNNKMVYFVHSFVPVAKNKKQISSFINFNKHQIDTSVHHKNIVGFQFHPEKSGNIGLNLLENTIEYFKKRTT